MIPAFDTDLDLAFLTDDFVCPIAPLFEDEDGEDIAEILTVACESFSSRSTPSSHGDIE